MKRRHWIGSMAFCAGALFFGGLTFADPSCPTLTGEWDVTSTSVYYEPAGTSSPTCASVPGIPAGCFGYTRSSGVLYVTSQDGCRFYGYFDRTDDAGSGSPEPNLPLVGVTNRSGSVIRVTGPGVVFEGSLSSGGKRIEGTSSTLEIPTGRVVNTDLNVLRKRR